MKEIVSARSYKNKTRKMAAKKKFNRNFTLNWYNFSHFMFIFAFPWTCWKYDHNKFKKRGKNPRNNNNVIVSWGWNGSDTPFGNSTLFFKYCISWFWSIHHSFIPQSFQTRWRNEKRGGRGENNNKKLWKKNKKKLKVLGSLENCWLFYDYVLLLLKFLFIVAQSKWMENWF